MRNSLKQHNLHFNKKRGFFAVLVFISVTCILPAQETQFSLYQYSPLYFNPANTGNFAGNWRAGIHYRNQSAAAASAFTTATASFDARLKLLGQTFTAGGYFLNDESGIGGLNYNKFYGSVGYEKVIASQVFILAVQAGFVSGKVNSWQVWNPSTRDFTSPNGEANFGENISYFDLNAGFLWKSKFGKIEPELGVALGHLNTPTNSFFGDKNQSESMRTNIHARAKVNLSDKLFLLPTIVYSAKNSVSYTQVGTDFGYRFLGQSRVKQVFLGAYMLNGITEDLSALSFRAGTSVGRLDIAVDYDIPLAGASGQGGAFEIGIIYRSVGLVLNSYSIPCERY